MNTGRKIVTIDRHGKFLWVQLEGSKAIKIHLSSTGWFTPANEMAQEATQVDGIKDNFLHNVNEAGIRFRLALNDGQIWNYHDPRTWGRLELVDGDYPSSDPQIARMGPDWIKSPRAANWELTSTSSTRTLKDLLTDQSVAAGVGNYLAVEACFLTKKHPLGRWNQLTEYEKDLLAFNVEAFINLSLKKDDHSHWSVFGKAYETCPSCRSTNIQYVKDSKSAKRGSYFCPTCQRD